MAINIIAACDNNYLIGLNGKLPWHIPADLKRFKELTTWHAVIMGRNTFESLGSKPLPGRRNIVLSRKGNVGILADATKGLYLALSLNLALDCARYTRAEEVFIIGGERLYAEALPIADRIYLTQVDTSVDVNAGDTAAYFPYDLMVDAGWAMTSSEVLPGLDTAQPSVAFQIFERRQ